nr:4-alpha-glucanotransferase [Ancylobacter koreensis]
MVELPDGRLASVRTVELPDLPLGRHVLALGDVQCRLTVAPPACYLPPRLADGGRITGIGMHLYTLRRAINDQGIGDFTALGDLAELAAGAGVEVLGLNPLHALFPGERERASPYSPSDRRFLDPIYIDVAALGADSATFAPVVGGGGIDYPGVWAVKLAALEAAFAAFCKAPDGDFDRFVAEGGETLARFALHQAISAAHPGIGWRDWPGGLADADGPAPAAFGRENTEAVRFALWQQWIADRQFAAAAGRARAAGLSLGLYRDLAVGTTPDGAEAWSEASMLMQGVSVGAPPDPLGPEGQDWSLPPFDPLALTRDGYARYAGLLRANMRHAGALRIDHVMGLRRLFLIPHGASGADGAYLAMPFDDLAGQVALESVRAECLVVGEDLGTVPFGMHEQLAGERMLSYRVLWFERQGQDAQGQDFTPPQDYPTLAAACISTHDLPTLAGWWTGADIAERHALGLDTEESLTAALAGRARERARLAEALLREGLIAALPGEGAPLDDAFLAAAHAYIARTPSVLAFAQLDDLAGETVAVNLPGTDRERPNWRRRLTRPLDEVMASPTATAALAAMRQERGRIS